MNRRERGAAMLIALGGLALISALAAAALTLATAPTARAVAAEERARATRAAEAAIHRLAAAMAQRELRASAPMDGTVISTAFLGAEIDFAAQDAAGLVDLNMADREVIERLFTATGADRPAILTSDLMNARESRDGRGGFASLAEIAALLPDAPEAFFDHATVWSGRATVDPWTATAPAFAAAADVPLEAAQRFVANRLLNGRQAALPERADLSALAVSEGEIARITVRAETEGGGRAEAVATLRATSSPRAPVTILSWR